MTAIVGISCTDGIVLGTDSSATFAAGTSRTIEQPTLKLHVIRDSILVAATGPVGLAQRFETVVTSAWDGKQLQNKSDIEVGKLLCVGGLQDFQQTGYQVGKIPLGVLVAFPCSGGPRLCEFELGSFQPELKPAEHPCFCTLGSTQYLTDPFLGFIREVFWEDGPPTLQEGIFATIWTLRQAIDLNPGGVGGNPQIGVLERKGGKLVARALSPDEIGQHEQNISAAKQHLREFPKKLQPAPDRPEVPQVPLLTDGDDTAAPRREPNRAPPALKRL